MVPPNKNISQTPARCSVGRREIFRTGLVVQHNLAENPGKSFLGNQGKTGNYPSRHSVLHREPASSRMPVLSQ
jgi:hypothetical protein